MDDLASRTFGYFNTLGQTTKGLAYWFYHLATAFERWHLSRGETTDADFRYWEYIAYFYYTFPDLPENEQLYFFYQNYAFAQLQVDLANGSPTAQTTYAFYLEQSQFCLAGLITK